MRESCAKRQFQYDIMNTYLIVFFLQLQVVLKVEVVSPVILDALF